MKGIPLPPSMLHIIRILKWSFISSSYQREEFLSGFIFVCFVVWVAFYALS